MRRARSLRVVFDRPRSYFIRQTPILSNLVRYTFFRCHPHPLRAFISEFIVPLSVSIPRVPCTLTVSCACFSGLYISFSHRARQRHLGLNPGAKGARQSQSASSPSNIATTKQPVTSPSMPHQSLHIPTPAASPKHQHQSNLSPKNTSTGGTCPGDGRCDGTGGASACSGCPTYNNSLQPISAAVAHSSTDDESPDQANGISFKRKDDPASAAATPTLTPVSAPTTMANKKGAKGPGANSSAVGALSCANCGTSTTPLWRRDDVGNNICNACGESAHFLLLSCTTALSDPIKPSDPNRLLTTLYSFILCG
jgi:GATA zinc finger